MLVADFLVMMFTLFFFFKDGRHEAVAELGYDFSYESYVAKTDSLAVHSLRLFGNLDWNSYVVKTSTPGIDEGLADQIGKNGLVPGNTPRARRRFLVEVVEAVPPGLEKLGVGALSDVTQYDTALAEETTASGPSSMPDRSVTRMPGRAMASGIPGSPAPLPTSSRLPGVS